MTKETGRYYEHPSGNPHQPIYYTFTPKPLNKNRFYSLDEELSSLLIKAYAALGILEGMDLYMPDRDILQNIILYKECCCSRLIDYSDMSPSFEWYDMHNASSSHPIQNIMQAYKTMSTKELSINKLENICGIAKYGSDSNEKMLVRENPMFLSNAITNIRRYSPSAPEHISPALKDIIDYLKRDTANVLVKAAMAHYQFEMIHPFDCYNGIAGRMLIRQILSDPNHCAANYLSVSEFLYKNKNDYFDILSSTQMSGGYIRWIKFFVAIIINAAQKSRAQIVKYHRIVKQDEEKILKSEQTSIKNTLTVFEYWKRNPVSNITQSSKALELSYNTVERAVQLLQNLGILEQISSTQRNRQFVYTEMTNLFKLI